MEGKVLALAVGAAGLAVTAMGTVLLYAGEPPPAPERPRPPPPPEVLMNGVLKYSQPVYKALLESDARTWKLPVPQLAEIGRPNPYFLELRGRRRLKAKSRGRGRGAAVETPHLRVSIEVSKRKSMLEGQSFAVDHLVLRIENRTSKYLAYRVETTVSDRNKCSSKGDLPHNALVLEPRQSIARTECLYRSDETVELTRVEVMELPPLSAHYVSRLPANPTLYDPRTSAGHAPLSGTLCPQTFSWRDIQEGIDRREIGWRDVIDFYARHNCEEYSFFRAYRYRMAAADPLPARPLD